MAEQAAMLQTNKSVKRLKHSNVFLIGILHHPTAPIYIESQETIIAGVSIDILQCQDACINNLSSP